MGLLWHMVYDTRTSCVLSCHLDARIDHVIGTGGYRLLQRHCYCSIYQVCFQDGEYTREEQISEQSGAMLHAYAVRFLALCQLVASFAQTYQYALGVYGVDRIRRVTCT